jgi:hypothetical protein
VDATALCDAYIEAAGGSVPEDHPVYTICHHANAHTPTIEPHLATAIAEAASAPSPGPLFLYDRENPPPRMPRREEIAHCEQVQRLTRQGTWKPLSEAELLDPKMCKIVAWATSVFKGDLTPQGSEQEALDEDDTAKISQAADARAQRTVAAVAEAAAREKGKLRRGAVLETILTKELGDFTKVRSVANFGPLSRGCDHHRLTLLPHGIPQSGFQFPSLMEMLVGAGPEAEAGKVDMADYFFLLGIGEDGQPYYCVATYAFNGVMEADGSEGVSIQFFAHTGASMGAPDSPILGEAVSSLIATVVNARGAATPTNPGFKPMVDDMVIAAPQPHLAMGMKLMVDFLEEISAKEAVHKRVMGPRVEILGKDLDFPNMRAGLTPKRRFKYLYRLHTVYHLLAHPAQLTRREVTQECLQSLAGFLQWASECSNTGAAHISTTYAASVAPNVLAFTSALLQELGWWRAAVAQGRSLTTTLFGGEPVDVSCIFYDASDTAVAAVGEGAAVWAPLSKHEQSTSSTRRELKAAITGTQLPHVLAPQAPGVRPRAHIWVGDNMGLTAAINKARLKSEDATQAQRKAAQRDMQMLYEVIEGHNLCAAAIYIPRELNSVPDEGSKAQSVAEAERWAERHNLKLVRAAHPAQTRG